VGVRSALNGLTRAEAAEKRKHCGPNRLRPATQRAAVLPFLAHFRNPLVIILLVASGISAVSSDVSGAIMIGLIVVMSWRNPLRSHPNRWLVLTSLSVVAAAMVLPFTPLSPYLGFTSLPMSFFGLLTVLLIAYLLAVEEGK
jgi:magnesium-transporting ATPase (P-type)